MGSNSLTPFTHPKSKREEGRRGDNAKATTSATFVTQVDKEVCREFKAKLTQGGKDGPPVEQKKK